MEEVVEYMGEDDALLIRNVEGEEPKNWIENYSKMNKGKPEIIEINEDLYMDCFDSEYLGPDPSFKNEENEFYLRCYKF